VQSALNKVRSGSASGLFCHVSPDLVEAVTIVEPDGVMLVEDDTRWLIRIVDIAVVLAGSRGFPACAWLSQSTTRWLRAAGR